MDRQNGLNVPLAPTPIVSSLPAGVFALDVPNSIKCLIEYLAKLFHCIRDVQKLLTMVHSIETFCSSGAGYRIIMGLFANNSTGYGNKSLFLETEWRWITDCSP